MNQVRKLGAGKICVNKYDELADVAFLAQTGEAFGKEIIFDKSEH